MSVNHVERQRQLTELRDSPGWGICRDILGRQITLTALNMARSMDMSQQEIDRLRGAIWAMEHLLGMPDRLIEGEEIEIRKLAEKEKSNGE